MSRCATGRARPTCRVSSRVSRAWRSYSTGSRPRAERRLRRLASRSASRSPSSRGQLSPSGWRASQRRRGAAAEPAARPRRYTYHRVPQGLGISARTKSTAPAHWPGGGRRAARAPPPAVVDVHQEHRPSPLAGRRPARGKSTTPAVVDAHQEHRPSPQAGRLVRVCIHEKSAHRLTHREHTPRH